MNYNLAELNRKIININKIIDIMQKQLNTNIDILNKYLIEKENSSSQETKDFNIDRKINAFKKIN